MLVMFCGCGCDFRWFILSFYDGVDVFQFLALFFFLLKKFMKKIGVKLGVLGIEVEKNWHKTQKC